MSKRGIKIELQNNMMNISFWTAEKIQGQCLPLSLTNDTEKVSVKCEITNSL